MKICTKCKEIKQLSAFYKDGVKIDKLTSSCKICILVSASLRYSNRGEEWKEQKSCNDKSKYNNQTDENYELYLNKSRAYSKSKYNNLTQEEKDKRVNKNKINRLNRTKEQKEEDSLKKKLRRQNDIQHKLKCSLRSRLNKAIKNSQKSGSAVDDLGCSIEEFKKHIENQFEPWMNWDNWGKFDYSKPTWQLDHIIPLANFDLTNREDFLRAAHYSNMQPLLAKDNLKKGSKQHGR